MTQEQINMVFTMVVIPLLTALTAYAVNFLKLKAKEISDKVDNDMIDRYIWKAESIVSETVTVVSQTFVDSLKKSGEWNNETAEKAFTEAFNKAQELLSDEMIEAVEMVYGDFYTWLKNRIEFSVKVSK